MDEDGICDDVDECVGTYDECGICNGDFNDFDSYGIESLIGTYTFYQDWGCDTLGDPEQMNGFLYIYENGIVRLDVQNTLFEGVLLISENCYDLNSNWQCDSGIYDIDFILNFENAGVQVLYDINTGFNLIE